jgi:hypothetical protein
LAEHLSVPLVSSTGFGQTSPLGSDFDG